MNESLQPVVDVVSSNSSAETINEEGIQTNGNCNLIVNYLPHDIDDLSLRELFEEFGEIIMTKVVRDKNTKKSLGYGFVKFSKEYDAMIAIEKMNGHSLGHKIIKVTIARPPSLDIRNCKLYVTNLPKEYTEVEVMNLFKEFGEIIECRVLKEPSTKVSKGVAFVQFNVKSQANNALTLNGCQLEGSSRGLIVKYAEDQHKKKELTKLHNLTLNTNFRGASNGNNNNQKFRSDDGMGSKPEMMNPQYYYQAQSLATMYSGQPSPMQLVHSPVNGGQMLLPNNSPTAPNINHGGNLDYSNQKRGAKSRKGFGFDSPTIPPNNLGAWYGVPQPMSFMPNNGLPAPPALHPAIDMNNFPPNSHLHGISMNNNQSHLSQQQGYNNRQSRNGHHNNVNSNSSSNSAGGNFGQNYKDLNANHPGYGPLAPYPNFPNNLSHGNDYK